MAAATGKLLHGPAGVGGGAATSTTSSPPPSSIRVLDTALVRPSLSAPQEETSLPLTFFDVMWLHLPPVQTIYLYRLAPDADVAAVLANLKDSLSHALGAFYPLAGRLRLVPGGTAANRYEHHYRPGDAAVVFTVAEYDDDHDLDSLAADEPRKVSKLAPLALPLPAGGAVLALQATLLPARAGRGLALGVTVHHAAADGAASAHFLHTWAAAAACSRSPPPPVIDGNLISDPRGLYDVLCPAAAAPATEEEKRLPSDLLFATFTLSRDQLQLVKDAAAFPRCTSLVAALGLVWSSYERAKPPPRGGDRTSCLVLAVDHRSRLKPPLPNEYFGNCVGSAIAAAPSSELAGTGGILAACTAIAAGIADALSGDATETAGEMDGRFRELAATTTAVLLTVAWSPRFRVYELDFGFGRPAKVDVVSVARTGAVAVAESRAGDGGIEVGLALQPEAMHAFRKCFADAVAGLELAH